uniref:Uncharacterized protein n=1 Tax=Panagrolaimus sp. JU765 TaxID=591449 RepID=A0AC34PZZ2_9BILA
MKFSDCFSTDSSSHIAFSFFVRPTSWVCSSLFLQRRVMIFRHCQSESAKFSPKGGNTIKAILSNKAAKRFQRELAVKFNFTFFNALHYKTSATNTHPKKTRKCKHI